MGQTRKTDNSHNRAAKRKAQSGLPAAEFDCGFTAESRRFFIAPRGKAGLWHVVDGGDMCAIRLDGAGEVQYREIARWLNKFQGRHAAALEQIEALNGRLNEAAKSTPEGVEAFRRKIETLEKELAVRNTEVQNLTAAKAALEQQRDGLLKDFAERNVGEPANDELENLKRVHAAFVSGAKALLGDAKVDELLKSWPAQAQAAPEANPTQAVFAEEMSKAYKRGFERCREAVAVAVPDAVNRVLKTVCDVTNEMRDNPADRERDGTLRGLALAEGFILHEFKQLAKQIAKLDDSAATLGLISAALKQFLDKGKGG